MTETGSTDKKAKSVRVLVEGTSWEGEEKEVITSLAEGSLYARENTHYLFYKERIEGSDSLISNRVEIAKDRILCQKTGAIQTRFLFLPGEMTEGFYQTPLGAYPYQLWCEDIQLTKEEGLLLVHIDYLLCFQPDDPLRRELLIKAEG